MEKLSSGKSRGLEFEIKAMMNKAESDGYRRLLNTMYTNLNTKHRSYRNSKKTG
ncbi:MAG: hypothetical protein CM15mP47_4910 [Methanobacteriota archaeon]|nr:MAG: hypothetical protein CM15mP47_4910 [Euryarchaeota archaeon]